MKHQNCSLKFALTATLLAVSCSTQLLLSARADETGDTSSEAESGIVLSGGVKKAHDLDYDKQKYELAVTKLASRAKMTSDDFRALQIGVTGTDVVRTSADDRAVVGTVFPGCPAEQAGIKKGDIVISGAPTPTWPKGNAPAWAFTGGRAGTTMDFKVQRKGQMLDFTLTRMNIEDIPDAKLRKFYENMAEKLGPNGEGTVAVSDQTPFILKLARFLL